MWWCPVCKCEVPGEHVTFQETHDPRFGGCGAQVGDKPKPDLNEFVEWEKQGPKRRVKIEIENGRVDIRAYDFTIGFYGQTVNSVSEINLQAIQDGFDRAEYTRLKAKFEPEAIRDAI